MKLRMVTVAVLVALVGMLLAPLQTNAAPKPTGAVPVPVTGDGSFVGQFLLERVELSGNNDGLVAVGDLVNMQGNAIASDISWPIDLAATQARAANVLAVPGEVGIAATCDILELVLGPLDLNLLGLQVNLSQVILTITGETGALLGNLLCGLLGGLDLAGLLGALNTFLDSLGGFLGALNGLLTILDGLMQVTNFARTGNQVVANGTLAGNAVSAPLDLAASQASCAILNLVVGPLDLNLLGLVVELNQVTLDITAVPGAGLLGDLLCAVANLLNGPGSLTGLTALLNNILRALGRA